MIDEPDICNTCGEELDGSSHYHCAHCGSSRRTGMLGHYTRLAVVDGSNYLLPEHQFSCDPGFAHYARSRVEDGSATKWL